MFSGFDTPELVLKGAQYMFAKQLACEPLLRKTVRHEFYQRARINITPTKKGRTEIDENHPIYSRKYLIDKPLKDLEKDDFLKLVQVCFLVFFLKTSHVFTIYMTSRQNKMV